MGESRWFWETRCGMWLGWARYRIAHRWQCGGTWVDDGGCNRCTIERRYASGLADLEDF